ncbi:MAG: hypothetical protein UX91_C0002G0021 [Candidatus Amesbacteria bacterium GW2011_GWB1_47_19]|nr:MAG: hypothetical protein UW51_C0004G0021 [Candidatus Amesbacteria bacterium GW2011_GWA1_44_24]KKU31696.1 MAG: hypothetical protein UX46_C0003G0021 [Candidatus Amesbacteria bacterium GW2011_GWC1_46_24]KKU67609.1 MAG: hypothetical protein UX91_C0002G0021 [Candidatus Amesbacteria bacterium GW2011_GWB1_47_19]OGD06459.1 MAG: hypothetical protein A2379_02355 [Candidatus Amesbacteria bacterium RIFOXYB1_FULL_47_13]HBC72863.1 sugar O-acetyltransferase [Candidatus Amesbacteria bacterium]
MLINFLKRYSYKQILLLFIEDHLQFLLGPLPSYEGIIARRLMYKIFLKLGKGSIIYHHVIFTHGFNIKIGNYFSPNCGTHIDGRGGVEIGDYVLIGPNVFIASSNHVVRTREPRINFPHIPKPTYIGSNVWIGANTVVCPGVKIGDNSIVAAGSIVTKDVAHNVIVAGNPARVTRTF